MKIEEVYRNMVRNGDVAGVERMLEEHPETLGTQQKLNWYLHQAARFNQVAVMAELVQRDADFNGRYSSSYTQSPVHIAAMNGSVDAVRWLFGLGAEVTYLYDDKPACDGFIHAVIGNHLEILKLFVENEVPLKLVGEEALFCAKHFQNETMIKYLQSIGVTEKRKKTDEEAVKKLAKKLKYHVSAIVNFAIDTNDIHLVKQSLSQYPETVEKNNGATGFFGYAIRYSRIEIADHFLGLGASINGSTDGLAYDFSPVHEAAEGGNVDALRWLISRGAPLEVPLAGLKCPGFVEAAEHGHLECLRILVEAGAPIADDVEMAWKWARNKRQTAVVEYLRSLGFQEPPRDLEIADLRYFLKNTIRGTVSTTVFECPLQSELAIRILIVEEVGVKKVLASEGMSREAMRVPEGNQAPRFAEVMIRLPADWPLDPESLKDDQHRWPVDWVRRIAEFPHANQTFFGASYAFDNKQPLGPGTRFTALLVARGSTYNRLIDSERITVYSVYPLYPEEMELYQSKGVKKLLALFDEHQVTQMVNPHRDSVLPS
ncbi:MAG: suppressor of fused domain protein [Fimbriiglobus sp.]